MTYGYENLNYEFHQVSEIPGFRKNEGSLDRIFTFKKYKRSDTGKIIPPKLEDDELNNLYNIVESGDIIVTSSLINFSPSTDGILSTLKMLLHKGARVISIMEEFDSDLLDRKTLEMITVVSQEAQRLRRASQKKGIEAAKKAGKYKKSIRVEDLPEFDKYYQEYLNNQITKAEMAKRLGISRPTLDRLLAQRTSMPTLDILTAQRNNIFSKNVETAE